jgi:hypothetical protein
MNNESQPNAFSHYEPFVSAVVAGQFLDLHPVTVQRMARRGSLPGHPLCRGKRVVWRFLLSELAAWLKAQFGGDHPQDLK